MQTPWPGFGRTTGTQSWPLQDAKARFSEVVRAARSGTPQHVTLHGRPAVVVVAAEEWERLTASPAPRPSLVDVMARSPARDVDLSLPREELEFRAPVRF
jgi:prevent-host-death family protein